MKTDKDIPVVIFCGGKGTRMKEETEFRPKPMVLVGGKPILWHIMKIYEHYGFNNFIIALGYKGDYIKDYFINQENLLHDLTVNTETGKITIYRDSVKEHDNFNITFVDTGEETLTSERLLRVKSYIKSPTFMVTYGDGVGNVNIDDLVTFFEEKKTTGVITGVHPRSKWGLVVADNENMVKKFQQKPQLNQYVNGGFMVFNTDIFDYLNEGEMIEVALERLAGEGKLAVYNHEGYWNAVDTYQDLELMNEHWQNAPLWKVWK